MRRVHVPFLSVGVVPLDATQSHHARSVLRIQIGEAVEAFDAAGRSGVGVVDRLEPDVALRIDRVDEPIARAMLTVASAVPKGDRADWLVEKLSELGIDRFIPLRTARSVVHPQGEKTKRWERIAIESAKQCRRTGVMRIDPLTPISELIEQIDPATAILLSTHPDATPIKNAVVNLQPTLLLIGPEGDWSETEEADLRARGLTAVSLGRTILRVETAGILAAGFVQLATVKTP